MALVNQIFFLIYACYCSMLDVSAILRFLMRLIIYLVSDWVKKRKLRYLGLSPCHGFGSFEHNSSKYRFLVIERFGKDLQKLLEENNRIFPVKTVCLIGLSVVSFNKMYVLYFKCDSFIII